MRIAEDLYMDGFISYPRTDNTVYPSSLPVRELVSSLVKVKEFSAASGLLDGELTPTRGKKETTDHPPIYPTQAIHPGALGEGPKKRVYELVVRRFLATFSPPMITESTRADIEAGSETYFVRGSVVVDPGYAGIYTYARSADDEIPALQEGQTWSSRATCEDGANPGSSARRPSRPARISQAKLIELMEERNLGTKATRADIIQKLFDRGYVYGNPPIPTETGIALYEAFKKYVPGMATPEMTAQLEAEMDRIAAGEMTKGEVVGESRELLHKTWSEIDETKKTSPKSSGKGWTRTASSAPARSAKKRGAPRRTARRTCCGSSARKNRANASSAARAGPSTIPKSCDQTFPLPQRGDVFRLEERCSICERDAAAESPAVPRPALEPLPERRLRVDAGDEETPRRARSGESGQRSDGEKAAARGRRGRSAREKSKKAKAPKRTPPRAGANAPKPPPKAEARGRCSSRSRESTARARAPRRSCWSRRWARRPC